MSRPAERPVLFSDAMVLAILERRKFQTRRVIQCDEVLGGPGVFLSDGSPAPLIPTRLAKDGTDHAVACPYDAEALWVREAWRPCMEAWRTCVEYRANGGSMNIPAGPAHDALSALPKLSLRFPGARKERHSDAWRPSIHLPRWASRITLHGITVRVERLQAISEEDARAEGVEAAGGFMATAGCWRNYGADGPSFGTARESFVSLWDSINAARGFPWASNPWVWVVGWERAEVRT